MASNIYGGDEVNALVVDVGSFCTKAGYAGDDVPKAVFPSTLGVVRNSTAALGMDLDSLPHHTAGGRHIFAGQAGVSFPREHMEVVSPYGADDLLVDWELVESLYTHAFVDRLRVKSNEFAVMLAEPSHSSKAMRERLVELMFEKFGVPALFLAKAAVLSSFAVARQTSLVVDAGYRGTTVTAVQDGYVLEKSIVRSPMAGMVLSKCMAAAVEAKGNRIRPRCEFKRSEVHPGEYKVMDVSNPNLSVSFRAYCVEQIAADAKEACCQVPDETFVEAEYASLPQITYELPDGNEIHFGADRFKVGELLFSPGLVRDFKGVDILSTSAGGPLLPLHGLVLDSVSRCDVDVRKELYSGVVLTGGTSLMPNLKDRLERELQESSPQLSKLKLTAPSNALERRFSTWIGGSILASLGSFQQMWLSQQEYQEHGPGLIHRKAP